MKIDLQSLRVFTFAFLILSHCSCDPIDRGIVSFGQEFRLEFDQSVTLEDGTEVRFLELLRESRCPEDALCAWEGEAVIAVAVEPEDRYATVVELRIPGFVDRYSRDRHHSEILWGYRITLLQLDPYPLADHAEAKHRYVSTLIITRVES